MDIASTRHISGLNRLRNIVLLFAVLRLASGIVTFSGDSRVCEKL